jgi:RNA polymerase sigma-54 factor
MSLSQSFQQKLLQKLSPQQIQLMKLLQVPTANLEERIKEEMEENPALEIETEGEGDEYEMSEDENNDSDNESEGEYESEEIEEPDVNEYLLDDDG